MHGSVRQTHTDSDGRIEGFPAPRYPHLHDKPGKPLDRRHSQAVLLRVFIESHRRRPTRNRRPIPRRAPHYRRHPRPAPRPLRPTVPQAATAPTPAPTTRPTAVPAPGMTEPIAAPAAASAARPPTVAPAHSPAAVPAVSRVTASAAELPSCMSDMTAGMALAAATTPPIRENPLSSTPPTLGSSNHFNKPGSALPGPVPGTQRSSWS